MFAQCRPARAVTESTVKNRRIGVKDLAVGRALPWDVFGERGSLLVRQGYIVTSEQQLQKLLERGYIAAAPDTGPRSLYQPPPSVLRLLNQASSALATALAQLARGEHQGRAEVDKVAALVTQAVELDAGVASACIVLNQGAAVYAARHPVDCAVLALVLCRALKVDAAVQAAALPAALTMNLGMYFEQERLRCISGQLNEADRADIWDHPQKSVALLRHAGIDDEAWLACILEHHENDDGSGYPAGKTGSETGMAARIVALADRYCARISARSYRKALLPNPALRDMLLDRKCGIDAGLVTALIRALGIYPLGSFVRLADGEIGVVTGKTVSLTAPYVHALTGPRGAPLELPLRRDTRVDLHAVREVLSQEQAGVKVKPAHLWGTLARE
jgi:HD-GYP domain-containing protein (c-di-GMP phosphodiesterase class II)